MMMYLVIAGVVLLSGATLVYALKKIGKMGAEIDQFKDKEKARGEIDDFTSKCLKKTDNAIDAPDKLEPWM